MIAISRVISTRLLCLVILCCVLQVNADTSQTPSMATQINTYPEELRTALQRSKYKENVLSSVLRHIRQTGSNANTLQAQDIDKLELKRKKRARINQVRKLLEYDHNNDGVIEKSEMLSLPEENASTASRSDSFRIRQEKMFLEHDLNKDDKIDFKEMRTLTETNNKSLERQVSRLRELLSLDPNEDNILTADELTGVITQAFNNLDTNNDGILSSDEKKILNPSNKVRRAARKGCELRHPDHYDTKQLYKAFKAKNNKLSAYLNEGVPEDQSYEMHVVGSYRGNRKLKILPTEKPLVIVLASYEASIWTFDIHKDARIREVILQGNKEQRLKGLDKSVKVSIRPRQCAKYEYQWEPRNKFEGKTRAKYTKFIQDIQQFTGLIESSFQGASKLPSGVSIPLNAEDFETYELTFNDPSTKSSHAGSLKKYRELQKNLPKQVKSTMKILVKLMEKGKLPIHFPNDSSGAGSGRFGARYFEELNFDTDTVLRASKDTPNVTCENRENAILLGDNDVNNLSCAWGNQIHWGGDGVDNIDDSWGADIINGGKGDDIIDAGWGRDIIVFEKKWGADIVDKTCHHSKSPDINKMYGGENNQNWSFPYINFVVFGPGIYERDMEWQGSVLLNKKTKDKITFEGKCFNFVYYENK